MKSSNFLSKVLQFIFSVIDNGRTSPFPTLPANVRQMTDEEIKTFIKKNDPRKLKEGHIIITRTADTIGVIIQFRWHSEHIQQSSFTAY